MVEYDNNPSETDGRRLRSEDTKQRIVNAMLELVREGKIAPTAEDVAQRANVGLRTVFRRFKDMESLYTEMSVAISAQIAPIVDEQLHHSEWWRNLDQLLARRLRVYEIIMPYRIAADALRFHSTALLNRHLDIVSHERAALESVLPTDVREDEVLLDALEATLSFDMWNQLRNDQSLPVEQARLVVYRMVAGMLPQARLGL